MKKVTTYFANLKISSKLWCCMLGIALTLSVFLGLLNSWYFVRLYHEDTYAQTADSLQIGSQALSDSYNTLLNNVIDFASTADFSKITRDVHDGNHADYGRNKALIQDPMANLALSNPILDTMAVIGKNGEFYSLFTNTLKKEENPAAYFGWDLSSVDGVTWLPARQSPFIKSNIIVPVVVPIEQLKNTKYLHIARTAEQADVTIIMLLDNKSIAQRLTLSNSAYAERNLYIANQWGENISLDQNSPYYSIAMSKDTAQQVRDIDSEVDIQFIYDSRDYGLYGKNLDYCGLKLVSILPKTLLHQRIARMNTFIVFIALAGLAITTLLAFKLSRFVTKPFEQLITNVQSIESNTYDKPYQTKYNDEVGHLNMAINSMYATIQQQFECIKQSERAKYRSEIQLLSEQINPHFLYNTLECINMEVLGGHKEAAASMITSLGDFLRIGLSYGNEVISISKEITHVRAYIDIMNHRFNRKIDFQYTIASDLKDLVILKSILQPLAENSIRHGFDVEVSCYDNILMPAIEIHVMKEEGHIVLEVSDNGRGINIEKANSALYPPKHETSRGHVGLYNIYQRLNACYGEVTITIESIPYFKNTVKVMIPDNDA